MEQAAPLERLEVGLVQAHHPADVAGDLLHAPGVAAGERVALVHGAGEGGDGLGEHLPHLGVVLVREAGHVERQGEQQAGPRGDHVDLGHQPPDRREAEDARADRSSFAKDDVPHRLARPNGNDSAVRPAFMREEDGAAEERRQEDSRTAQGRLSDRPLSDPGTPSGSITRPAADRRQHDPGVVREGPIPRHVPPELAESRSVPEEGYPGAGRWPTQDRRRHDRRDRDREMSPAGMLIGRAEATRVAPVQKLARRIGAQRPHDVELGRNRVAGITGNTRVVAMSASTLIATTPAI